MTTYTLRDGGTTVSADLAVRIIGKLQVLHNKDSRTLQALVNKCIGVSKVIQDGHLEYLQEKSFVDHEGNIDPEVEKMILNTENLDLVGKSPWSPQIIVTLRDGSEVSLIHAESTYLEMCELQKTNPEALKCLVYRCVDPIQWAFKDPELEPLQKLGLLDSHGVPFQEVQKIVLNAVSFEESGKEIVLRSPADPVEESRSRTVKKVAEQSPIAVDANVLRNFFAEFDHWQWCVIL